MNWMDSTLFSGIAQADLAAVLNCLQAQKREYAKGEAAYRAGDAAAFLGVVTCGSVNIEYVDVWGNTTILGHVRPGEIFAEAYACFSKEPIPVNVIAAERTEVLFLNAEKLTTTCSEACQHHQKLIQNLLRISAEKNIQLSRKILHTSSKSIRGRLLSYFSEQVARQGRKFTLPFNRQQLADYLGVDRSAMSNELSKMRRDGIVEFEKNSFVVKLTRTDFV